jgi:hypothetical protein
MRTTRTLALGLALAVVASAAACGSSSTESSTTDAEAGTERAAARGELYNTTWPVPTADSWRTSSIATGGLPDQAHAGFAADEKHGAARLEHRLQPGQ